MAGRAACHVEILGSAVQQDGPSASLTAPNGSSQRRLLESVLVRILRKTDGSDPALEAHGTGTALGDPIEVRRLLETRTCCFVAESCVLCARDMTVW